jgi:hypothetical protein
VGLYQESLLILFKSPSQKQESWNRGRFRVLSVTDTFCTINEESETPATEDVDAITLRLQKLMRKVSKSTFHLC